MNKAQRDRREHMDGLKEEIAEAKQEIKWLRGRCRHTIGRGHLRYEFFSPVAEVYCEVCDKNLYASMGGAEDREAAKKLAESRLKKVKITWSKDRT